MPRRSQARSHPSRSYSLARAFLGHSPQTVAEVVLRAAERRVPRAGLDVVASHFVLPYYSSDISGRYYSSIINAHTTMILEKDDQVTLTIGYPYSTDSNCVLGYAGWLHFFLDMDNGDDRDSCEASGFTVEAYGCVLTYPIFPASNTFSGYLISRL